MQSVWSRVVAYVIPVNLTSSYVSHLLIDRLMDSAAWQGIWVKVCHPIGTIHKGRCIYLLLLKNQCSRLKKHFNSAPSAECFTLDLDSDRFLSTSHAGVSRKEDGTVEKSVFRELRWVRQYTSVSCACLLSRIWQAKNTGLAEARAKYVIWAIFSHVDNNIEKQPHKFVFLLFNKNWRVFWTIRHTLRRHLVGKQVRDLVNIPFRPPHVYPSHDALSAR